MYVKNLVDVLSTGSCNDHLADLLTEVKRRKYYLIQLIWILVLILWILFLFIANIHKYNSHD